MSLPRSAALAAWIGAVVAGRVSAADAVTAVVDEEVHETVFQHVETELIATTGLALPDPGYLFDLFVLVTAIAEQVPPVVRVVLPAPGDALGVPRGRGLLGWACDAGECVVIDTATAASAPWGLALVPDVTTFGSVEDEGVRVTWNLWTTRGDPAAPALSSVAEADLSLRTVLHDVTRSLERLDVATWRRGDGPSMAEVAAAAHLPPLPDTLSTRSRSLLMSASEVLAIVDAATGDDGGAVTGHEIGRRADALVGARRAARRAIEAAVNLPG